jgi:hypothetical protein
MARPAENVVAFYNKRGTKEKLTKPAFPPLGAPMSPAWVHGSPHVKDLALLKSLRSCNFTLAKAAGGCRETSHFE